MLLDALLSKIEHPRRSSAIAPTGTDYVLFTAKAERMIPSIRQYSGWLVSQASILKGDTMDADLASELGRLYTKFLNILAVQVPSGGRQVDYLLVEDEKTLGFLPLDNPNCECSRRRYYSDAAGLVSKPRWYHKDITRLDSTEETQARTYDIIADGLYLQRQRVSKGNLFAVSWLILEGEPFEASEPKIRL